MESTFATKINNAGIRGLRGFSTSVVDTGSRGGRGARNAGTIESILPPRQMRFICVNDGDVLNLNSFRAQDGSAIFQVFGISFGTL
uniref:Uncharacterized protein n=1 Tax=Panagrolaimus sp. JU765 TaxID=591449 RepID=A0AC34RKN6_9BILA